MCYKQKNKKIIGKICRSVNFLILFFIFSIFYQYAEQELKQKKENFTRFFSNFFFLKFLMNFHKANFVCVVVWWWKMDKIYLYFFSCIMKLINGTAIAHTIEKSKIKKTFFCLYRHKDFSDQLFFFNFKSFWS